MGSPSRFGKVQKKLFKAGSGSALGLLGDPLGVVFFRNHFEVTFHSVMGIATKLGAIDIVFTDLFGGEMGRNNETRNSVLSDSKGNDLERMDNVQRTDVADNRFIHRNSQGLGGDEIVLAERVILIQAEFILIGQKLEASSAELTIFTRVTAVPLELLGNDANDLGILFFRKFLNGFGPNGDGEADEQDGFNESDDTFDVGGEMTLHAVVVGFGVSLLVKTEENVNEITQPTHEKGQHENVHPDNKAIDSVAVRGGINRKCEIIQDRIGHA